MTEEEVESEQLGAPMLCRHNNPQPSLSMAYFVSFIFICSFSMLSLFVGAITVSMSESMQSMKEEKEKLKKLKKLKNAEKKLDMAKNADRRHRRAWALVEMAFLSGKVEVIDEDNSRNHILVRGYKHLSKKSLSIVENGYFQNFVTLVIIAAGVQVGLSTDKVLSVSLRHELSIVDAIIRYIFTIEVVIKVIAEELTPWAYFENNWNTFDFIVVIGSYVSGGGSIIVMLRLLRLLRVLKLMRMLPQLQVIVSALMSGFSSITFISIILLLFFYFFGIIAMILFRANDPWHFGTLHMTMIVLFQCSTLDNWTDILYINLYGCDVIGYDSISHLCENPSPNFIITSLFFIVFILLGALVLLTLFIGVVATSMEEATDDQKQAADVERRVADIRKEHNLPMSSVDLYREVFAALDLNAGSSIDSNELRLGMKAAGRNDVTDEQFRKLWRAVDRDNSGGIDFAEFLSFMMSLRQTTTNQLQSHQNKDASTEQRILASNTRTVAEQLYEIASSIGPLDSSVKMKELVKKTSLGRPNSAPRVLNRLYSHEHNVYEPKESYEDIQQSSSEMKTSSPTAPVVKKSLSVEVGAAGNDSVRIFHAPSDVGATTSSHHVMSPGTGSSARHPHLPHDANGTKEPGGPVTLSAKPGSKQGSNRSIFSRGDARVVPSAGLEGEKGVGGGSAFSKMSHGSRSDHDSGKSSPVLWAEKDATEADVDDRAAQYSSRGHLDLGDCPSPNRKTHGKMKKVVSRVCFI